MKRITVITPCYNEEVNVQLVYETVREVFQAETGYSYQHLFIDNASRDRTVTILREIAGKDQNVKVIVNARNFGHIRSPYHAMLQAKGDAIIFIVADLQDPPSMIHDFLRKWEQGFRIVIGVKSQSEESPLLFAIRKLYYRIVRSLAEVEQVSNFTGFGLYDRSLIEILRRIDDPYPYFRGLIADIGFERAEIEYTQKTRKRGITKNNFYTLYDLAMLGITNHSKVPLRLATMTGFAVALMSLLVAFGYFVYKLIFWDNFSVGIAPLVIGLFFFSSVQLFFIGIVGEYIGAIHTQVLKRPLVIEKERINFD
ncbi:MAG: glycosyltransferase [Deltaproteobacteria bacterium HGW-Deltaproteobacteria-19]|jgi:glycosyltransferase involved in cell wall biosynthesis|nr:MAG: glycosyltransferase [Deltaproteobacteria bacterium HGW-Deltaproteobacteria-19]